MYDEKDKSDNMSNKPSEERPALKKVFGDAVKQMGPALIAAMGTRDPKQIYAAYVQGQEQARKDEELEANREALLARNQARMIDSLRPNFDMGFIDKSTGEVVKVDKSSGRAYTLQGQLIENTNNIVHEESYRQTRSLDARNRGLDISEQGLFLKQAKEKSLSDKQIQNLSNFKKIQKELKIIKMLKPGVNTGPVAARMQMFLQSFGISDASDDFIKLRAASENIVASYLKSISGAQVSEKEARRLMNVVPRVNDDDNVFAAKLQQFENLIALGGNEFLMAISSGQPLRKELAIKLASNIDAGVALGQQIRDDAAFSKKLDKVIEIKMKEAMSKE